MKISAKSLGIALFSMIVFMLGSSCPVEAQGIQHFALPSSPHPHLVASFGSLNATLPVTSSVPPTYHSESFSEEYGFLVSQTHSTQNLATLFPLQETRTSFITEVRVPVAQLYGSRLRVGLFIETVQNGNITLGPLAASQVLHTLSQPRSVNLYGVGFSIPLSKQEHSELSSDLPWRTLQHFFHDR
jgi:hypothetical protein